MVYEKSDESRLRRARHGRPRSLVVARAARRSSEATPSTHPSSPAGQLNEEASAERRLKRSLASRKRPTSQPGTPDAQAAVARSQQGRMPFEIETLPILPPASDSYKDSPQPHSPPPAPEDFPVQEPFDLQKGVSAIQPDPLQLDTDWERLLAQPLGADIDPNVFEVWPRVEPLHEPRIHFARLLRKVRKLTDEVLLKRTEWRHENDQLDHRKRFLNISTTDMMEAMMYHLPDILRIPSEESSLNRTEESGKVAGRNSPSDEDSPSDSNAGSSEKSSQDQDRAKERSSATDSDIRISERNNIAELNRRYHEDYRAVQAQEVKVTRLADDLSSLEYRLATELTLVQERMYAGDFISDLKSEVMESPLAPSERSSQQSSEAVLPPLVAQYFDMKGDVGIYQERLQELDFAHDEGLTERAFVRERGDPVVPSDQEFDYNYWTKRKEIEQDLKTAQEEVHILRQRCLDAGHAPEEYRTSRVSLYPASTQPSANAIPLDAISPEPLIQEVQVLGQFGPSVHTERHSTQRIDTWLRAVQPEPTDTPPHLEPEVTDTPPHLEPEETGTPSRTEPEETGTPSRTEPEETEAIERKVSYSLANYEWDSFDLEAFRNKSRSLEDPG